jgi:hypothetical protein
LNARYLSTFDVTPTARQNFRDFAEALSGKTFGNMTSREQGLALTRYYVTEIHNKLSTEISDDDLEDAIVDGGNDLGVDLVHRDDNAVLMLQAKYFKDGTGPTVQDIIHFQTIFDRITDPAFKKSSRLLDKISEIDYANDTFTMRFIALGKITGQALEQTKKDVRLPLALAGIKDRVTYDFLDESDLTDELRNALSQSSGLPGKHD